jgi:hypothetical protein
MSVSVKAGCFRVLRCHCLIWLDATLRLRYLEAPWPVDRLIEPFLTDAAPDCLVLEPTPVWLQIRGVRGSFRIDRLDPATFAFRIAVARRLSLGEAADLALSCLVARPPWRLRRLGGRVAKRVGPAACSAD